MSKRLFAAFLGLIVALGNVVAVPAQAAILVGLSSPSNVVLSNATSSSLQVTWDDNSQDETEFYIELTTDGNNFSETASVLSSHPGIGTQSYTFVNLSPNAAYQARVTAKGDQQNNADSAPSDLSSPVFTFAKAPTYPSVGFKTATSLTLSLTNDGNPAATSYSVQYTDNTSSTEGFVDANGVAVENGPEIKLEMATWNGTGLVKGLIPNHAYSFKVKSFNGDGINDVDGFSFIGPYQTLSDTPQFNYIQSASSSLSVTWKSGVLGGNEVGYEVGISSDNGNTFSNVQFNAAGPGSPDVCMGEGGVVPGCMFTAFTGLTPATQYVVRVGATNDNGDMSVYAVRTATTSFDIDTLTPVAYNITDKTVRVNIPNGANPASIKYYLGLRQANGFDKGGNPILLKGLYTINPDGTVTFAPNTPVTDLTAKTAADWNATVISGFEKLGLLTKDYVFQLFTPLLGNPNEQGGWADDVTSKLFTLADAPVISVGGGGGGSVYYGPVPMNPAVEIVPNTTNLNTNTVQLKLAATNNPTQVAVSLNKDFSGSSWQTFASPLTFTFGSNAGGAVTVYAKFKNSNGESAVATAPLFLDRVAAPLVIGQVLGEKISIIDELIAQTTFGQKSDVVKQLQTELKNAGYFTKNFKPTNYYGVMTKAAVEKYLADQMTVDQLIAGTKYGQSNYKVFRLQTELLKLGLMPKNWKASYFYGVTTKAAVAKYLASK